MTNNDPNSNPAQSNLMTEHPDTPIPTPSQETATVEVPATLEVPLDAPADWEPEGDTEPEDDDVCLEGDNHDHAQDAL